MDRVGLLILVGIEFVFMYLVGFVEEKVLVVSIMYGWIVGLILDKEWSLELLFMVKLFFLRGDIFVM